MDKFLWLGFSYPWVILCAPLPWITYHLLRTFQPPYNSLIAPSLFVLGRRWVAKEKCVKTPRVLKTGYFLLPWSLLLLSTAGPYYINTETQTQGSHHHLLMALDISDSMSVKDVQLSHQRTISRLKAASDFLHLLTRQFSKEKIGLILFGSKPYLVTPLTYHHSTINDFIKHSKTGMAGEKTAIGDTMALGIQTLTQLKEHDHSLQQTLIILTDGANTGGIFSPEDVARYTKNSGIRIYTLGVGSSQYKDSNELDETSLKYVAETTGATYLHIEHKDAIKKLTAAIEKQEKNKSANDTTLRMYSLTPWLLCLALLMSFPWMHQYSGGRRL